MGVSMGRQVAAPSTHNSPKVPKAPLQPNGSIHADTLFVTRSPHTGEIQTNGNTLDECARYAYVFGDRLDQDELEIAEYRLVSIDTYKVKVDKANGKA